MDDSQSNPPARTPTPLRIPRRWRLFAEHLLRDPNAARAARAAGVRESNARRWASRTKGNPRFLAYFADRLAEAEHEAQLQTHRILTEVGLIAHSSIDDYEIDYDAETIRVREGVPEDRIRAIAAVTFRRKTFTSRDGDKETTVTADVRLWNKNDALTVAMKHKALLVERHEHTGKDGAPIEVDSVRERIADRLARLAEVAEVAETKEGGS